MPCSQSWRRPSEAELGRACPLSMRILLRWSKVVSATLEWCPYPATIDPGMVPISEVLPGNSSPHLSGTNQRGGGLDQTMRQVRMCNSLFTEGGKHLLSTSSIPAKVECLVTLYHPSPSMAFATGRVADAASLGSCAVLAGVKLIILLGLVLQAFRSNFLQYAHFLASLGANH